MQRNWDVCWVLRWLWGHRLLCRDPMSFQKSRDGRILDSQMLQRSDRLE